MHYDVLANHSVQIYGVINNLTDANPPVAPQVTTMTNTAYFDQIGRSFKIGAKFKY